MYGHPDAVFGHSVRIAIHFFVNFDIFKQVYLMHAVQTICQSKQT